MNRVKGHKIRFKLSDLVEIKMVMVEKECKEPTTNGNRKFEDFV